MSDNKIIQSWCNNATPWIAAVREQQIESRRTVTDRAIIDALTEHNPATVLDIGCGEGWLARALAARGMQVTGVDVVPGLIDAARQAGDGEFHVLTYEALLTHALERRFDALVCNFSMLGESSTATVFQAAPALLNPGGKLFVQTLHPVVACGDEAYRDGWRQGSWQGFNDGLAAQFTDPAPWFFRTLESWQALFADAGLTLIDSKEPRRSASSQPASVILIGCR
ncbi:class I SAM-dependent methyltransferase [Pseudohongiella sp.]|uniref:Methyltransferase domain-containing protein n=1 Tax=marine sediment metagenome TaxID=412755 RepID=A0A0F9YVU6_9ZZZZ|nr:class I SAM-dependent methyltransferase [Pseudohongiella sp.]HDZ08015.1 class I SAM-dependent methyltransferase [Pseudohongiella sp.]HEA64142.1 class I SAM-dependent methyltransferase [Pseudohongiella sp.]